MSTCMACHESTSSTSPTATACRPPGPACPSSARRWSTSTWAGSAWRSPRSASRSCSTRCPTCGRRWRSRRRARSATCACPAGAAAVAADVEKAVPLGLRHYNLSISTSDQMIKNKFRGRLDRDAIIREMVAAVRVGEGTAGPRRSASTPRTGRGPTTDSCTEFALAAKEAGADRVRYCDTIGGDTPGRIRRAVRHAGRRRPACRSRRTATTTSAWPSPTRSPARSATSTPARTPGSTRASTASASAPATPTCSPRSWPSQHGFGLADRVEIGDPLDLSWARRFALWAGYAFGQPLPYNQPGVGAQRVRARVRHPRRRRAQGPPQLRAVRRGRRSARSRTTGTPAAAAWCSPASTAERPASATSWTGSASRPADEELAFQLVQLCNATTGRPLTDDELRLIARYPAELALLFPGQLD